MSAHKTLIRYDPYFGADGGTMEGHNYGDWVLYEDVEPLLKQHDELLAALKDLLSGEGDQADNVAAARAAIAKAES
jgi:hypothetical protein